MYPQHEFLREAVMAGIERLTGCSGALHTPGVDKEHHRNIERRVICLGEYLDGSIRLLDAGLLAPSYALLRCALEQQLVDRLAFTGTKWRRRIQGMSQDDYDDLKRRWEAGDPQTEHIIDLDRNDGGQVTLVRKGPRVVDEDGELLWRMPIYQAYLVDRDPFVGITKIQDMLEADPEILEMFQRRAEDQAGIWGQALSWARVVDNLVLNDQATEIEALRWSVHYGFLSGFVHIAPAAYDRLRPRGIVMIEEDLRAHCVEELPFRYAAAIGGRELENLIAASDMPPQADLRHRAEYESLARQLRRLSECLWLPGDTPTMHDRIDHSNQVNAARRRAGEPIDDSAADVPDTELLYYRDPLRRLMHLHNPHVEHHGSRPRRTDAVL